MGADTTSPRLLERDEASSRPLDDPPLFCHGPNPNLADQIDTSRPVKGVPDPFSADIAAGKNTYLYDAHTYHTKVPPDGIRPIIEHYTRPGDVIIDPFCGSGMAGIAALQTGRIPILIDLSPAATFIAYNLLTPVSPLRYLGAVRQVLAAAASLEEKLYATRCPKCSAPTVSLYTVWAYRVACPRCDHQFQLWDVALDERPRVRDSKVRTQFACPACGTHLTKRSLRRVAREPVSIGSAHCMAGPKELTAPPSPVDSDTIGAVSYDSIPDGLSYPKAAFPDGVNTRQAMAAGIRSVDKAYTPRALWAMSHLWDVAQRWPDDEIRRKLLFTVTSLYQRVTVFSEFRFWGGSGNIANYAVPAIMNEQNVFRAFERKARTISWYFGAAPAMSRSFRLSTQSSCSLAQLPDRSVDFAFTDPPFGANINYSEMNFLWESWLGRYTDPGEEAIVNKVQGKDLTTYRLLLERVFSEVARVLKDDAWLVLLFHNSSSGVWSALQRALGSAGFAVCGAQTLDKRHGTFKQFVSHNAVGYDLVLHCQKARSGLREWRTPDGEVRMRARQFIADALARGEGRYVTRYLHVRRPQEIDERRLYSEWLAQTLLEEHVQLGFEEFREVLRDVLRHRGDAQAQQQSLEGLGP